MPQFTGIIDSTTASGISNTISDSTLFRFEVYFVQSKDSLAETDVLARTFVTEKSSVKIVPKIRKDTNKADNSSLLILSLVLILFVLSKQLFPRRFQQLWQAIGGETKLNLMLREWNPSFSMPGIVFFFTYTLLLAKFLQLLATQFLAVESRAIPAHFYWQILSITGIVVILRLGLKKFIAQLFKAHEINTRYNANEFSYNLIASLILFLGLLTMIFQQGTISFYIASITFIIILTYNLLRSLFIGLSTGRFSILYLFLYLCALEIVPFLLLIKTVSLLASGQFSLF
ncbi:MAG: DUF4271 domain-containing protein [Bacteroidales bacterium]|nr:DUF4271 domain-containing protein [Bacteroidales bacterium]